MLHEKTIFTRFEYFTIVGGNASACFGLFLLLFFFLLLEKVSLFPLFICKTCKQTPFPTLGGTAGFLVCVLSFLAVAEIYVFTVFNVISLC